MLAYGDQKTGKTVFACSFPKPLLLIDILEEGTDSVSDVEGVEVYKLRKRDELEEMYWFLEKDEHFKSVVLDQCTGLYQLCIRDLKEKKGQRADDVFSDRSYGQVGGWMTQWLLNYRELIKKGKNVCYLAHQKRIDPHDEDDERLAPEVTAAMSASVVNFVNGAVSVIGNTFVKESYDKKTKETEYQYCMRLVSGFYRCGIRRPVSAGPVPEFLTNPTFTKIQRLVRGESLTKKVSKRS